MSHIIQIYKTENKALCLGKNANLCYMLQFSVDIALAPEGITHTEHSSLTKGLQLWNR